MFGFNGLGKDNFKTRQQTFKSWDLVPHILEIWRYLQFGTSYLFTRILHGNFTDTGFDCPMPVNKFLPDFWYFALGKNAKNQVKSWSLWITDNFLVILSDFKIISGNSSSIMSHCSNLQNDE